MLCALESRISEIKHQTGTSNEGNSRAGVKGKGNISLGKTGF